MESSARDRVVVTSDREERVMRWFAAAAVLAVMGVLGGVSGCAKPKPPPPPAAAPATADAVQAIRDEYKQEDPNVAVGPVEAVKPETQMAAVGGMPLKDFHEGDPVVFVDSSKNPVTTGRVVQIDDPWLIVKYEEAGQGFKRVPQTGDIAVRVH